MRFRTKKCQVQDPGAKRAAWNGGPRTDGRGKVYRSTKGSPIFPIPPEAAAAANPQTIEKKHVFILIRCLMNSYKPKGSLSWAPWVPWVALFLVPFSETFLNLCLFDFPPQLRSQIKKQIYEKSMSRCLAVLILFLIECRSDFLSTFHHPKVKWT